MKGQTRANGDDATDADLPTNREEASSDVRSGFPAPEGKQLLKSAALSDLAYRAGLAIIERMNKAEAQAKTRGPDDYRNLMQAVAEIAKSRVKATEDATLPKNMTDQKLREYRMELYKRLKDWAGPPGVAVSTDAGAATLSMWPTREDAPEKQIYVAPFYEGELDLVFQVNSHWSGSQRNLNLRRQVRWSGRIATDLQRFKDEASRVVAAVF